MKRQRRNANIVFNRTGAVRPGRSVFDLSFEVKFTAEMGKLYPMMSKMMMPGDVFKLGNQSIIRMLPLNAPVLHSINCSGMYFFVPLRLLWNADTREQLADLDPPVTEESGDWETFITGGRDGLQTPTLPRWNPTNTAKYSLWDYFGHPVNVVPTGMLPVDWQRRAYNFIFNEWLKDQTLQDDVSLLNEEILVRNWSKDYPTSALPQPQRGTAPAMPIAGFSSAEWSPFVNANVFTPSFNSVALTGATSPTVDVLNNNVVDLSTATTFDLNEFREAFASQRFMERSARCGSRYVETLQGHWGLSPNDRTLQRPEFVGSWKTPLIVSEVLQTSETTETTPQGNMVGHGIGVSDATCGRYMAYEYGILIGLFSIMPDPAYNQGVNREWLQTTKFDYPWPEFMNLGEQAVFNAEICAVNGDATHNTDIFGYQGRYNEYRVSQSYVAADMRDTFNYWHLAREFSTAAPPQLNEDFIQCNPSRRIFADEADPGFVVSIGNLIKAIRPIPASSEPGLIDHV